MKRIYPIEENCVTCKLCETACVVEHSRSKNVYLAWKEQPKPVSKTTVHEKGPLSFSAMCRHCDEPECVNACPNNAISKDSSGRVMVDVERCQSCWMCLMSCRFSSIKPYIDVEPKAETVIRFSSKCDLCPDRKVPACVDVCPNGALVYEDRDAPQGEKSVGAAMETPVREDEVID